MVVERSARGARLATSRWMHDRRCQAEEWYKGLCKDLYGAVQEAVHEADRVNVAPRQAALVAVEDQYQRFMVNRFDRMLGSSRREQLAHIGTTLLVSEDERELNRHIGAALVCMGTAVAGILVFPPLLIVSVGAAVYSCLRIFRNGYTSLVHERKLRMDVMGSLYFIGAFAGGYFVAGAFGLVAFYVGEKLVLITHGRSLEGLIRTPGTHPRTVWQLVDDIEVEVAVETLQAGDTVVIHPGQVVAIDGVITHGSATIDQHMLTGESQPVEKGEGDQILTSTLMMAGKVHARVEKTGDETVAAQILQMLNNTATYEANIVSRAEQLADSSVPPTMVLALIALPLSGYRYAVTVLGSSIGLNVKLTAPIAMLNFLNVAANHGVVIKDGRSLELLKDVDTVVFDSHSLVVVAGDGELVGVPERQPNVRPEVNDVVGELRRRGLDIVVISGDHEAPAREMAESLGIRYFAETSPEDKASRVAQLRSDRSLCFVGDGISNSIPLNGADVSVSLRGASTAAVDTAQVVLIGQGLQQLPFLFQLSDEFDSNMRQGFAIAVGQGVIVIVGAMLRVISIVPGIVIWVGSLLLGLGIAHRPLFEHRGSRATTPTIGPPREAASEAQPDLAIVDEPAALDEPVALDEPAAPRGPRALRGLLRPVSGKA